MLIKFNKKELCAVQAVVSVFPVCAVLRLGACYNLINAAIGYENRILRMVLKPRYHHVYLLPFWGGLA